jgi:hypothetical protein
MMKSKRAQGGLIAVAMGAMVISLLIQERGAAVFGANTDLFSGFAAGASIGLLLVVVLFAVVKAPPER